MNYAAVTVTFNRKEMLVRTLNSLLTQSIPPKKIVLVDNASTDGTYEYLKEQGFLSSNMIDYHRLEQNMGGAGGFAKAFEEARKLEVDWITISDDDVIYQSDYFNKMEEAVKRNQDVQAFAGAVMLTDGRIDITHRLKMVSWKVFMVRPIPEEFYNTEFEMDVFTFVGAFISMKVLREVELPVAGYFIWNDDWDYSVRVRKVTRILNVPQAKIVHDNQVSALDKKNKYFPDWRGYYGARNFYYTICHNGESWLKYPFLFLRITYGFVHLVSPYFRGYRGYEFSVLYESLKDFLTGKMGINPKFKPGSSKNLKPKKLFFQKKIIESESSREIQ